MTAVVLTIRCNFFDFCRLSIHHLVNSSSLFVFGFFVVFNATFSSVGRSRSTRREPPTMGKQLVNCITCVASQVLPFCNLQCLVQTHAVLEIGLYDLLGNPTTYLTEPPGPSSSSLAFISLLFQF